LGLGLGPDQECLSAGQGLAHGRLVRPLAAGGSASLAFSPAFTVTRRDRVIAGGVEPGFGYHANYDVSPDGSAFAYVRSGAAGAPIIVVHDWKYELRARAREAAR
jgi:hypothetical protein